MNRIAIQLTAAACLLLPSRAAAQQPESAVALSALDSLLSLPVAAAAKYQQQRSDVAASVSVITAEEIEAYGFRTLTDVFQTLPGFYVSDDLNYSYVGVRGFSRPTDYNNRLLVLLDGHVMNEPFYGSSLVGTGFGFDLAMLDRIEVVRGPGSALYGTSAMFAVVNLITKSPNQVDGLYLSGTAGSNGTFEGSLVSGKEWEGGLGVALSTRWSDVQGSDRYFAEFDEASPTFGMAEGLDWDRSFAARASLNYRNLDIVVSGSTRSKGIPTAPWEVEFNDPDTQTTDRRFFAEASLNLDLGPSRELMVRGYFDSYSDQGIYPYESNWHEESSSSSVGSEAKLVWDLTSNQRLVAGLEGQIHTKARFRSWDADDVYWGGDFPFEQGSVYVQDELQFGPASLTLGARYDAYSGGQDALTPRAAFIFHASDDATLKLLYGHAFRAPSVYEREYEAPDEVLVNPGLGPEAIRTIEALWEHRLTRNVQARASIFRYDLTDLIDFEEAPGGDPTIVQYTNTSEASAEGIELELTAAMVGGTKAYASYTFQNAHDEQLDIPLSNSAEHMAKIGFAKPFALGTIGANLLYESGRLTVQDTRTDAFVLLNLTVVSRPFANGLSASGSIKNVFDADHRTPGGWEHVQAAIPQFGRRIYVGLSYRR